MSCPTEPEPARRRGTPLCCDFYLDSENIKNITVDAFFIRGQTPNTTALIFDVFTFFTAILVHGPSTALSCSSKYTKQLQ